MRRFFLLLLMLGTLILTVVSALAEPVPLQVMTSLPQGKVENEVKEIIVVFNKPMVPLEALPPSDISEPLFQIEPHVSGKFRWKANNTLVFIADKPLLKATRFTVTIPSTLKALDGSTLSAPFSWSFETLRPRIINANPQNGAAGVDIKGSLTIVFNQNIPLNNPSVLEILKASVKLLDSAGNSIPISLDQKNLSFDFINIVPSRPLEMLQQYTLVIGKGIVGDEGSLGTEEDYVFRFSTYGQLKFLGLGSGAIYPTNQIELHFSNAIDNANIASYVELEPKTELLNSYTYANLAYFSFSLKPNTEYRGIIRGSLKDIYGNTLGQDVPFSFKTQGYYPSMNFRGGPGILESYGDLRIPIDLLNIKNIDIKKTIVPLSDVIPAYHAMNAKPYESLFLLWKINKHWNTEVPDDVGIVRPIDLREVFGEKGPLPNLLKPLLDQKADNGPPTGIVIVELRPSDQQSRAYERGIYQVTNIGLTGKFSPNSTLIWATHLKDATPAPGASIELRDENNKILWAGTTDRKGFAEAPGWKQLNLPKPTYTWQKPVLWVLASHPDGQAFISSSWDWGIETYRFGYEDYGDEWEAPAPVHEFEGDIFTERGIYRPGEEVQIKGIFRQLTGSDWSLPLSKEGTLKIIDPENKELLSEPIFLSQMGSFHKTFKLKESCSLNTYQIQFIPKGNENERVNATFEVTAFRPVSFKVEASPGQESYILGDEAKIQVRANYLYGAPLREGQIQWSITRSLIDYNPPGYESYFFGPYPWYWWGERGYSGSVSSGTEKLDNKGEGEIRHLLDYQASWGSSQYTVEARVQDPSRQEVSGRTTFWVHPGEFYIGLKPSSTFLKEGEDLTVDTLAVTPQGEKLKGKEITLTLTKREWKSVRKLDHGEYSWVTNVEETVIDKKKLSTEETPASATFKAEKAGFYYVQAEGTDSRGHQLKTVFTFYVTGKSYTGWAMENNDRIELVPDKTRYRPGDTARILVKSPYEEVDALVTLEREGVMDHQVVHLKGNADSIEIPIKKGYLPNVYLSVILIKGRVGDKMFDEQGMDLGKPSFKIGYINLPVDPGERHVKVKISTRSEIYRPGQDADFNLKVVNAQGKGVPSEVTVAVVDVGVLNLINYKTPDPFDIFYRQRSLSVTTAESRHHIIGQRVYGEKGKSGGGGDGEGGGVAFLEPRKDFRYTALWLPAIMTDKNGNAHVNFKLPEELTAYRIMVIAHTVGSEFGNGELEIKTQKPLMVKPILPRFVRPGESFDGGVILHNESNRSMKVALKATAEGVNIQEPFPGEATLEAKSSREIRWSYQVPPESNLKSTTFTFQAREASPPAGLMAEGDGVQITLPITPANIKETVGFYGNTVTSATEKVKIPEGQGILGIYLTSTALSGLSGTVEYLFDYPYGCLEQKMSKALPMILFGDVVDGFHLPGLEGQNYRKVVQEVLDQVRTYQKPGGGFGIWPDSGGPNPYVSVYTVFALNQAKKKGYSVNQDLIDSGTSYLEQILRETSFSYYRKDEENAVKAFALWVLADAGKYDAGYGQYLFEQRQNMPIFGRAMLLKAVVKGNGPQFMRDQLKQELLNSLRFEGGLTYIEELPQFDSGWIFNSNARSTAAVLQALLETEKTNQWAPAMARWLSEKAKGGRWRTTQENLFVFWALSTYFNAYEAETPNYSVHTAVGNKFGYDAVFKGRDFHVERKKLFLSLFKPNEILDVALEKKGKGNLYYKVELTYAPKDYLPPRDEGIKVEKTFFTLDGKPVTDGQFRLGEVYRVKVDLTTAKERTYVALESPVPTGFEVVNTRLATESQELAQKESQANYDSNYRWWYVPFNRSEIWDDRVVVFSDYLPSGTNTYSYLVRATIPGHFILPPDEAAMMYYPEIFGRSGGATVEIH